MLFRSTDRRRFLPLFPSSPLPLFPSSLFLPFSSPPNTSKKHANNQHTRAKRAFKFDPADLSSQTFSEDGSEGGGSGGGGGGGGGEGVPEAAGLKLPPARRIAASTPSPKRISAMGPILMTPEMEQEVRNFDLLHPLQHAMSALSADRLKDNRPANVSAMSPAQIKAEKSSVKRILRNFDIAFKEKNGSLVCPLLLSPFSFLLSPFSLLPSPFSLLPSPFSLLPSPKPSPSKHSFRVFS